MESEYTPFLVGAFTNRKLLQRRRSWVSQQHHRVGTAARSGSPGG